MKENKSRNELNKTLYSILSIELTLIGLNISKKNYYFYFDCFFIFIFGKKLIKKLTKQKNRMFFKRSTDSINRK